MAYYDPDIKGLLRYTIKGDPTEAIHYGWFPVRVPSKWPSVTEALYPFCSFTKS